MNDFGGKSYPWEPAPGPESTQFALLTSLTPLLGFIIPFGGVIAPLVIWLMKKETDPFVAMVAKQVLAFQVVLAIASIVVIILSVVTCGIGAILALPLLVAWIGYMVIGTVRSKDGLMYEYPLGAAIAKMF
jgi:uncharacterized Tic20 family protein